MFIREIHSYHLPRRTVGILGDKYMRSALSVCILAAYTLAYLVFFPPTLNDGDWILIEHTNFVNLLYPTTMFGKSDKL